MLKLNKMKPESLKTTHVKDVEARDDRFFVVRDLINVTWRMLTPTILGVASGAGIDAWLGSSPIGFLVGSLVGFVVGVLLAIRLINRVRRLEE